MHGKWRPLPALFAAFLALTPLGLLTCVTGQQPTDGGTSSLFNVPPNVVISTDVLRGIAPLTVRFDSSGSSDDGLIVSREWDFGDGTTSQDIAPRHTFQSTGQYRVRLTLTDDDGASNSRTVTISVTNAPVPIIVVDRTSAPSAPAVFQFDASTSYDPDGSIVRYRWDFGDGSLELVAATAHTFSTPGSYRVRLTVTDNVGVTASTTKMIQVGIPEPEIEFRIPPPDVPNLVLSVDPGKEASPLWVYAVYEVEPGVPFMITTGLDRDADSCDAQAVVYDALNGDIELRVTGHADRVRSAVYSPDGTQILTGGEDRRVRLQDAETGDLLRDADVVGVAVTALAFSPDGDYYAVGCADGSLTLRNTSSGTVARAFAGHAQQVNAVAFSANGAYLASASNDQTAAVWNVSDGSLLATLDAAHGGHTDAVLGVAFHPDNSDLLLTGGADDSALLWRVSDATVQRGFRRASGGHTDDVAAVAFTPDGQAVVTGGRDGKAMAWATAGPEGGPARTYSGHSGAVTSVAVSPDGTQLLTGSEDGTAGVWDLEATTRTRSLAPCLSPIRSVAFSPDGLHLLLAVAARNSFRLDANPPQGNDLNIRIPTALDLTKVPDEDVPGQYYLWAELDTDRTDPVRTYAAARINLVNPFTTTISGTTPRVPFVNDQAMIVAVASSRRQIFDFGPISRGDRLFLSMATMPGYGPIYDADVFSVLVLDASQKMLTWYQDDYALWTPDAKLVIGHDSPAYYVVVDGSGGSNAPSVSVRIQRQVGLVPRGQRIYLNFSGGTNVVVGNTGPQNIVEFDASDLNAAWGTVETNIIKNRILTRLEDLFDGYNVSFYTTAPTSPYQTVYFGGSEVDEVYGAANYIDLRNDTLAGRALVATDALAADFSALTADQMGMAIANVAAHHIGHLLGLRNTAGGTNDIMDPTSLPTVIYSSGPRFMAAPLRESEQYNGQIGIQDPPQLFEEVIGTD